MRTCLLFLLAFNKLVTLGYGQIYADVSVSHGDIGLGTFRIQLHHETAPRTVANFIGLATGERRWIDPQTGMIQTGRPYYDGLIFHRLIHDFMIQGGDPLGTGSSGPGYLFQDEFDPALSHTEYVVSMANSGPNSNGSQFFITLSAPTYLDNKHSVFGVLIDDANFPNSRALIDSFKDSSRFATDGADRPLTPITIDAILISGPDLPDFDLHAASLMLPEVSPLSFSLHHDSAADSFALAWDRVRKFDYPIYYSSDLENWTRSGNLLSMENQAAVSIDITAIATGDTGFYTCAQVDYSRTPTAPQTIFADGATLELHVNGGTLRLMFNASDGDSWVFVHSDGVTPDQSGSVTSISQTDDIYSYPIIPDSGGYINSQSATYARYLPLRQITVFLDGAASPDQLTAIQPLLSFHSAQSGWFDGAVNSTAPHSVTFHGTFSYTTTP
jgi:peptidyl-prolyl cis-trans isomerase A (cyclophilin A)